MLDQARGERKESARLCLLLRYFEHSALILNRKTLSHQSEIAFLPSLNVCLLKGRVVWSKQVLNEMFAV
jgi:hypothetical protein